MNKEKHDNYPSLYLLVPVTELEATQSFNSSQYPRHTLIVQVWITPIYCFSELCSAKVLWEPVVQDAVPLNILVDSRNHVMRELFHPRN